MALTPAQPALLGMTPELRLQVYKHVFHGATCYTTLHGPVDSMERRANDELKSMMIILQLNKQLRLEAMPVLHERLTVVSFIRDDIPPLPSFCRGAHTLLSDKPINYETCRRSLPNLQTADFFGPTMFINCYTQDDLASMLRGKEDWFHCDRVKSMFNGCNGSDLLYLPTPYNGPSVSCTVTFTIRARIMWTFVGPWGSPCIYRFKVDAVRATVLERYINFIPWEDDSHGIWIAANNVLILKDGLSYETLYDCDTGNLAALMPSTTSSQSPSQSPQQGLDLEATKLVEKELEDESTFRQAMASAVRCETLP
ncbi:hypothetical protein PMZ80_007452 [Knufia obscura]|uniref:Uncharacterized protein n=1 Tax=Knufia obscura TaxID=1635080 RepID=A0ABR0RHC7_9EURO|nr:hypothetical protein PMZ80_007452 [Knufia obscura]